MTATERCAYMRFTFPSTLAQQSGRSVTAWRRRIRERRRGKQEITGYNPDRTDRNLGPLQLPNFKGYFVVEFRKALKRRRAPTVQLRTTGAATGAYAEFARRRRGYRSARRHLVPLRSSRHARICVRRYLVGLRYCSQRTLRSTWNEKLSRVAIDGATDDQRKIVYTGLYHALLYPRIFSE